MPSGHLSLSYETVEPCESTIVVQQRRKALNAGVPGMICTIARAKLGDSKCYNIILYYRNYLVTGTGLGQLINHSE
jgi:hypothetical protein